MRTLVTGGAGFIGSHIQDALVKKGYQVAVVDNLRSGKTENLHPKAAFFQVDIRDKNSLAQVFAHFQPEIIFHLAAQNEVPYSMEHPFEDQEMNIVGTMNLLELATKHKVKKFVYTNTGGAFYGDVAEKDLPLKEDYTVTKPTSFYGVSKATAELYLKLFGHVFNLPWISLRYPNVYGPRQDGNREAGIVAIFCTKMLNGDQPTIYGDGKHTRDYIYVADVVAANLKAMNYLENDYFNISTGKRTSNREVFDLIKAYLKLGMKPVFGPTRPGDARHNCLSPAKAKKLLEWESTVSFPEGIRLTLDYYSKKI